MTEYGNIFDEINAEETVKQSKADKPVKEFYVIAYQIYQIKKTVKMGDIVHQREIIDTIPVVLGQTERAKNRAVGKARNIGNCTVIELLERNVIGFDKADDTKIEDED